MKILLISNSFGVNLQQYASQIAEANGFHLDIYTLYIGGCSLETHDKNIKENNKAYELFFNGKTLGKFVSIDDALNQEKYDFISLQQASHLSGEINSYFPFIDNVCAHVRKTCKNAKLIFHKTWSYSGKNPFKYNEVKNWMPTFAFNKDIEMNNSIKNAVNILKSKIKFDLIIDSGEVIFEAEKCFENVYDDQGFHLNNLGCYLIGLNLVKQLFGKTKISAYFPNEISNTMCLEIGAKRSTLKFLFIFK